MRAQSVYSKVSKSARVMLTKSVRVNKKAKQVIVEFVNREPGLFVEGFVALMGNNYNSTQGVDYKIISTAGKVVINIL